MSKKANQPQKDPLEPIKIGIVRPISKMDEDHSEQHWEDVHFLIEQALSNDTNHSFEVKLVSEVQDADIIQATIIQNLFESDVVICDMTLHNPNVFFELGLRIAFRKPCIVIQEEGTKPPFDVSSIRYIPYPCKLAYVKAIEFQQQLRTTVLKIHEAYINDGSVSTDPLFSKAKIDYRTQLTEIKQSSVEFVMDQLKELQGAVAHIQNAITTYNHNNIGLLSVEKIKQELLFMITKEFQLATQNSASREQYISRIQDMILDRTRRIRREYPLHVYEDIRSRAFEYMQELSLQLKKED
ncbi:MULTISPECIES: nucleotide-binding protein [Rodentibacter]|uniref:nucleotide-binding protein n=1 Tax=Rodentibacter TaxID=1960084 RepID=UPI001CFEB218|nr:nucleotide-binding protein [Rodentibacter sp. JRC1]GJI55887.1 hypothetical protein HEMROJRC1_09990 [Rodentibacter sp. JRC1]